VRRQYDVLGMQYHASYWYQMSGIDDANLDQYLRWHWHIPPISRDGEQVERCPSKDYLDTWQRSVKPKYDPYNDV
jgi:hypothetical protein